MRASEHSSDKRQQGDTGKKQPVLPPFHRRLVCVGSDADGEQKGFLKK